MELKKINESITVSPQITASDMEAIKSAGIRTIICNRPDGEEPGQPPFDEIAAAAKKAGIETRYIPVQAGMMRSEDVEDFSAALNDLPGPVLAYCRSGARSANLWSFHDAKTRPET